MNMNKMLRDFIAICSVTCCYDNKTTFITSMAAAFSCSSAWACTNRGVGNMFPSEVSRDYLKEFITILHRSKQAKRLENKTDGIKILRISYVPRHHNKIRL